MDSPDNKGPEDSGLRFCRAGEEFFVVGVLLDPAEDPLFDLLCEGSHWQPRQLEDITGVGEKLTLTFFLLQSSQAFMIRIRCACSLCSLVFVPRPAELVTSTPSLVMIENPGSLNSAAFLVSFLADFLETREWQDRLGGVMLVEAFPKSPNIAEELGEGVKIGLNPEDCECVGLCSFA